MTTAALHLEATNDVRPLLFHNLLDMGGGITATSFDPPGFEAAQGFLHTLAREDHISTTVADQAGRFLREVFVKLPGLPVPRIAPGPDGMVGMTWESGPHHVNVEVFSDGHVEFFYEHSETGELWDEEHPMTAVTAPLLQHLQRSPTR